MAKTQHHKETNRLLNEMLKWNRLHGIQLLRKTLPELLNEEKKRLAYEMTDGKNSQPAIAKKVGIAGGTVSNWWNKWFAQGIVTKDGNKYCKIISLKEIGIEISESEDVTKNVSR